MPIYEYVCASCQKAFEELLLRKTDERDVRCPACRSARVSRVMSRPAASRTAAGSAPGACGPVG